MVFEDATIELNNVYGWKRHNAECHKNRPSPSNTDLSIFQSEQCTFNNRIESDNRLMNKNIYKYIKVRKNSKTSLFKYYYKKNF